MMCSKECFFFRWKIDTISCIIQNHINTNSFQNLQHLWLETAKSGLKWRWHTQLTMQRVLLNSESRCCTMRCSGRECSGTWMLLAWEWTNTSGFCSEFSSEPSRYMSNKASVRQSCICTSAAHQLRKFTKGKYASIETHVTNWRTIGREAFCLHHCASLQFVTVVLDNLAAR